MAENHRAEERPSTELALAAYLVELARGRRVLWVGEGASGPSRLDAAGARVRVLAPDDDRRRGRRRSRSAVTRLGGRLGDEAFDLVVVPDLSAAGLDSKERVDQLGELLAPDGALVAGISASDRDEYARLFELASSVFSRVRMLGQAPFSGWTIVDFDATAEEQADVTLDGSLVGEDADRPAFYYALASRSDVRADPYAVVRVDLSDEERRVRAPEPTPVERYAGRIDDLERELGASRSELAAATSHGEAVEEDLAARTAELERIRTDLERLREARARDVETLEADLAEARSAVQALERREASAPDAVDGEHDRLEQALSRVAAELRDARLEVERRGVIVRDATEECRELRAELESRSAGIGVAMPVVAAASMAVAVTQPAPPRPADPSNGSSDRDRAIERAVEAEAARAEAQFAVDELMGRIGEQESVVGELLDRAAELEGRSRGLAARLSELEERCEIEQARRSLAEHDLEAARARIASLQGEVAEVREHIEHEIVRARGTAGREPRFDEGTEALAAHADELVSQLASSQDLNAVLLEERDNARAEAMRLTSLIVAVETRYEGARRGYEARIAELVHDARGHGPARGATSREMTELAARADTLAGEVAGLRARLADREEALRLAREGRATERRGADAADLAKSSELLDAARDESDRLRASVEELKERETDLTVRLADAEELSELEANRANDLSSIVASRDALVGRLQMDLAEEERRSRDAEERADRSVEENRRLREAVVTASERVSALEALERTLGERDSAIAAAIRRAERAEDRVSGTGAAMSDVRRLLAELLERVESKEPLRAGGTAVGVEAPDGEWMEPASDSASASRVELEQLERRAVELEREAEDRETLMRSLTAQLEERAQRIRSLEHRLASQDDPVDDAELVKKEVMELEERIAQISEELAHERRARRDAESGRSGGGSREQELKKLHETLGDRDAELLVLRGKSSSAERELKTIKEAAAQTRAGLEELLGLATASGDPGTAERVGGLLRILARF